MAFCVNPLPGKWEIVDPEGEFIKLYYWKRIGYVTFASDTLFKVARDDYTLEAVG